MSEGPTIGDWTQYGWIPDGASSFPAMVRLRNAAWMVYYEPGTVVQRERAENVKLRELVRLMWKPFCWAQSGYETCLTDEQDAEIRDKVRKLGVGVDA